MLAKYPGRCTLCAEPIRPGDSIVGLESKDASTWVHASCRPNADAGAASPPEAPSPQRTGRAGPVKRSGAVKPAMPVPAGAVSVYTDGACSGNPGPGGWAWAVDSSTWDSGAEAATTNQRMEIRAALEAVTALEGPLLVVSDSTYVVNCFRDRWWANWLARGWVTSQKTPVANRDLWEPLVDAVNRRGEVAFGWVKGHSGDQMNDFVDSLAVAASLSAR
jgi:ribonuclease HI